MSEKVISDRQLDLMRKAHKLLREAFPNEQMQMIFNMNPKYENMNYNIKLSGIR